LYPLIELYEITDNLLKKFKYKHNLGEILSEITDTLEKIEKELTSKGYGKVWKELKENYDRISELKRKFNEVFSELSNYTSSEDVLSSIYPEIYAVLSREITDPDFAEETIREYMKRYENGDEEIGKVFREVSSMTLEGFKETLGKLGIWFDSFDWESSRKIRSLARKVIEEVEKLPYARREEGALLLDLDKAAMEHKFISELFGKDKPGKFIVQRSDGTSLYTTRDVAYSVYKFREYGAKRVYNVIAVEQTREQKQVKATLYLIGYKDEAEKLIHFVYEMVNLKGMRMSSRRGQYYSLDELIEDYKKVMVRTYVENQKRKYKSIESPEKLDIEKLNETFNKLAVASSRALLLSIDPSKVLTFDPRRLEEYGLGSWIIYTFVRIQGILRKAFNYEPLDNLEKINSDALKLYEKITNQLKDLDPVERELIETIQEYPSTLLEVYEYLKPNKLLEYANNLCIVLNKLYETLPVLGEKDPIRRNTRIILVLLSFIILKDLLEIMGFPLIKKI
ncbi:MAG: arginine--tRNA ligase, partial [Staphylothermus sp.]|nr:arginine--tRNA ligase [Staphylothermus sp.]